jgi:putative tryptophan/tyrosine transport system substrate-binding protein
MSKARTWPSSIAGGDDPDRLPELAVDLVRRQVRVIVAFGSILAVRAAMAATHMIPVVFGFGSDPVQQGFVASLARPGGNITGTSFDAGPEITTKQLQLIIETVPKVSRVAVLWNPTSPFIRTYWQFAQDAASVGTI